MVIADLLALAYIRPEARRSAESFALKADPPQKKRFYRFFRDGPEGGSRGSDQGLPSAQTHTALEEAEKELELKNWKTSYTAVNNQLGDTLRQVQMRAQGDKLGVLQVSFFRTYLFLSSVDISLKIARHAASSEGNISAKRTGMVAMFCLCSQKKT